MTTNNKTEIKTNAIIIIIIIIIAIWFFWPTNIPSDLLGSYKMEDGSSITLNGDKTFYMSGCGNGTYSIDESHGSKPYDWYYKFILHFNSDAERYCKEYGDVHGTVNFANSNNRPVCQLVISGQTIYYEK